ncbi:AraC family transcriptional regulator [Chryseobacterium sp. T16E-39]|uniref:AraC family transcriptional regulator n=1 Tax=Chryseobacterium sp. T16E-39 TaxID=2015076 RepID=UPI000B5B129B|nr:AraC family transcriptional regulator [Chryseobacterium sp. T16E-39]ASK29971.1 AraC family transcriptional regulator [Chryseobacterium sp. T16E-39]
MAPPENILNVDELSKPYFVWFEDNWRHDDLLHLHEKKGQLVYVESGFQYLTVEGKMYLLPQNHAAWIPAKAIHKTNSHSERIRLMIMFFDSTKDDSFYNTVNVFSVPPVLKEMIRYAEKWSRDTDESDDENIFLKALYNELPNFVADSIQLHISLPKDKRLTQAINHLNTHYTQDLKMEDLSDIASLSLRSLERIFKKETGLTLIKYQQMLRIIKSLELLSANEWTISEIAYQVGYKSLQAYTNSFQSVMQYRPSDFIKNL